MLGEFISNLTLPKSCSKLRLPIFGINTLTSMFLSNLLIDAPDFHIGLELDSTQWRVLRRFINLFDYLLLIHNSNETLNSIRSTFGNRNLAVLCWLRGFL